ncbi:MAG: hypothetical protein Q8Q14_00550 [Gemmatimonadales bacterium]|nr:hypothetical protein [Gemmatimonadales bacterium]
MPAIHPQPSGLRPVARLVEGFMLSYRNRETDLIADRVLPAFSVGGEKTGKFAYTLPGSFHGRGPGQPTLERPRGAEPAAARGVQYGTVDYDCRHYAEYFPLDEVYDVKTSDVALDVKQAHYTQLWDDLMLDREDRAAQMFFGANFTADNVPSWANSGGTPINDIDNAYRAVWEATGSRPNGVILSYTAAQYLRFHDDIIAAQALTVDRSLFTEDDVLAWLSRKWTSLKLGHIGVAMAQTSAQAISPTTLGSIWDTQTDGPQMWIGHMSDGKNLGQRRAEGIWKSNNVAVVRPVVSDMELREKWDGGYIGQLIAGYMEEIRLVSAAHGRRITFA